MVGPTDVVTTGIFLVFLRFRSFNCRPTVHTVGMSPMASIYYVVPAIVICYATICVLGNVASLFEVFNLYQTVGPTSNKISPPRGAATRYAQRRRQLAVAKIAADLRPSADVSTVRTSLVAGNGSAAGSQHANIPRQLRHGTDRQTDGSRYRLMRPTVGWGQDNIKQLSCRGETARPSVSLLLRHRQGSEVLR